MTPLTTSRNLKSLTTTKTKLTKHIDEQKRIINQATAAITSARSELQKIDQAIEALMSGPLVVSEHAILRYLERVQGLNLAPVIDTIASPRLQEAVDTLGGGEYSFDGYTTVVRGKTVVTIKTPEKETSK